MAYEFNNNIVNASQSDMIDDAFGTAYRVTIVVNHHIIIDRQNIINEHGWQITRENSEYKFKLTKIFIGTIDSIWSEIFVLDNPIYMSGDRARNLEYEDTYLYGQRKNGVMDILISDKAVRAFKYIKITQLNHLPDSWETIKIPAIVKLYTDTVILENCTNIGLLDMYSSDETRRDKKFSYKVMLIQCYIDEIRQLIGNIYSSMPRINYRKTKVGNTYIQPIHAGISEMRFDECRTKHEISVCKHPIMGSVYKISGRYAYQYELQLMKS